MAVKEFKLPDIGEGIAEGEIVQWMVEPGQAVQEEDPFVEVMTDKATVTITVPWSGTIAELKAAAGDIVPVESVIAVIDTAGDGLGVRVMFKYMSGAFDPINMRAHGWKSTPELRSMQLTYLDQTRVLTREEKR